MAENASLSADTLALARAAARHEGTSLAAWLERVVRRAALRDAARRQDEWLAQHPEVREELEGFDRLADELESGWADLAGAA